jgi:hypothetical protein
MPAILHPETTLTLVMEVVWAEKYAKAQMDTLQLVMEVVWAIKPAIQWIPKFSVALQLVITVVTILWLAS